MFAKLGENLRDGPALLFGVAGARPLVANPEAVDAHLQDLLGRVLADGFDAGKDEDRKRLPTLYHAVAELHRPLLVEQEVLVQDREDHVRVRVEIALHHGEDIFAIRQQLDVFAGEKVRGAAKVAAVRAAQTGEDHSRARHLLPKHLETAHEQRVLVRHGDFGLAQQPPHVGHPFLAADVVRVGLEDLVLQHGPIAAQDDLGLRRIFADQRDRLLHLVRDSHHEADAHVIVALPEFADQFALGRILQHHRGGVEILGDVFE